MPGSNSSDPQILLDTLTFAYDTGVDTVDIEPISQTLREYTLGNRPHNMEPRRQRQMIIVRHSGSVGLTFLSEFLIPKLVSHETCLKYDLLVYTNGGKVLILYTNGGKVLILRDRFKRASKELQTPVISFECCSKRTLV